MKALDDEIKKTSAVDPAHALEFYRFAVEQDEAIRTLKREQRAYGDVLASLAKAHDVLHKAAKNRRPGMEELRLVLGYSAEVMQVSATARMMMR
jgi:hypothetical protein